MFLDLCSRTGDALKQFHADRCTQLYTKHVKKPGAIFKNIIFGPQDEFLLFAV